MKWTELEDSKWAACLEPARTPFLSVYFTLLNYSLFVKKEGNKW